VVRHLIVIIMWLFEKPYLLWAMLGLPAIPILKDFLFEERYYSELMYDSGVLSTQLLIVTLAVSPLLAAARLMPLLKPLARWLLRQRRYLGVSCFCYALIHLAVYLRQFPDVADLIWQLSDPEIALGWLAILILLILAVTSNNFSVKHLRNRWKTLHRLVYPAAALIYLHWYLIEIFLEVLHLWYVPIVGLQLFRLWQRLAVQAESHFTST